MEVKETGFAGLLIIKSRVFEDSRGFFFESYNKQALVDHGIRTEFVQDNQSRSAYGVIRGLHYQVGEMAQAKLVSALEGEVLDVVVDIRKESATFGKYFYIVLSAVNKIQLFIPRGFAHGFAVLSRTALFFYKCDNFYSREHERGIIYNDPKLDIEWMIPENDRILSEKDINLPVFEKARL